MEKFFDTNRKTILVVAGLGAATLAALVLKNVINKQRQTETIRPTKDNTTSHHTQNAVPTGPTKEEKASAIAAINVEYEGHHLSVKTMQQIIDAVKVHAAGKYIELVRENRIHRRVKRDHLEIYISLWYDFNSKVDEIIQKTEKEVLREINISETLFEDSASYHAGQRNNELALARVFTSAKLKEEYKSTKTISIEELKEILRGQIELTKKAAESREDVASKLTNPVEAASILVTQIYDHVYHRYTVEEEDIQAAMLVHGADREIQDLWMELQSALVMLTPNEPSQEEI